MSDVSRSRWWHSAWFIGVLGGVLGGACAGWLSANLSIVPQMGDLERLWQARLSNATSTPQIVSLEPTPSVPTYPTVFLNRRFSPVLSVVKRIGQTRPEALIHPDRTLGYAVSLTSDGWLAVPSSVLVGQMRNDLGVIWKNRWYPVTRGLVDSALEVGFIKIEATGLPVTGFMRAVDVTPGTPVWVEARPGELAPESILRADGRTTVTEPVSSERLSRRFVLVPRDGVTKQGGAVWNEAGELVGVVLESSKGSTQVLPGSVLSSVLAQALGGQAVSRSALDVRTIDLSHAVFEEASSTLPTQGMWVRAVGTGGPATKLLKEGDIIERIERDVFDGTIDLGERLLDYRPGSSVIIAGTRAGKPFEVSIKLGTTSTSDILK